MKLEELIDRTVSKAREDAERAAWRAKREAERELEIFREKLEKELAGYSDRLKKELEEEVRKETSRARAELRKRLYAEASSRASSLVQNFKGKISSFKKGELYRRFLKKNLKAAFSELGSVKEIHCARGETELIRKILSSVIKERLPRLKIDRGLLGGFRAVSDSGLIYDASIDELLSNLERALTAEAFEIIDRFVDANFA